MRRRWGVAAALVTFALAVGCGGSPDPKREVALPTAGLTVALGSDKETRIVEFGRTTLEVDELFRIPTGNEGGLEWMQWSPDGKKLLYGVFAGGSEVFVFDRDTRRSTRLETLKAHAASWSPDGRQLVVAGTGNEELLIADAASGKTIRVITGATDVGTKPGPVWAPDGKSVLYRAADGTGRVFETKRPIEANAGVRETRLTGLPISGPSGRSYVFLRRDEGNAEVCDSGECQPGRAVHLVEGGEPVRLTDPHFDYWNVTWAPGGGHVAAAGRNGKALVVDLADRHEVVVSDGFAVAWACCR